ncbi:GSCOCG00000134001-RA-CDS, partial [Cotesia congregata]
RLTVNLHDVLAAPILLVALHVYSPSSSGKTSFITRVATRLLYLRSTTSDDLKVFPFLVHVIWGSGSPSTLTLSSNGSPSFTLRSLIAFLDLDGLPVESNFEPYFLKLEEIPAECKILSANFSCSSVSPIPRMKLFK